MYVRLCKSCHTRAILGLQSCNLFSSLCKGSARTCNLANQTWDWHCRQHLQKYHWLQPQQVRWLCRCSAHPKGDELTPWPLSICIPCDLQQASQFQWSYTLRVFGFCRLNFSISERPRSVAYRSPNGMSEKIRNVIDRGNWRGRFGNGNKVLSNDTTFGQRTVVG
jgi:hypothetical protein